MQALTFDQSATVTRRTFAPSGNGGVTATETTATLSCRVAPATAGQRESLAGQQGVELQVWSVTFAAGADVRKADRIAVLGKTLEVQAVLGAESRETARVVLATERV